MINNNDFKSLTLSDIVEMQRKELVKLGKVKPTITMCLVDGEWVIDDSKKSLVEREVIKTINQLDSIDSVFHSLNSSYHNYELPILGYFLYISLFT